MCLHEADDEAALTSSLTAGAGAGADSESGSSQEPSTSPTTMSFAQVIDDVCHVSFV